MNQKYTLGTVTSAGWLGWQDNTFNAEAKPPFLPMDLEAGRPECSQWKFMLRAGSVMSSALTHERSSGQSMRYGMHPPCHL